MALTKDKKAELLAKIRDIVDGATSLVFVAVRGLSVPESTELRAGLRETNSGLMVVKKTILKKALTDAGVTGDIPELPGEIALGFGSDMVMPAKGVATFGKKKEGKAEIVGGVIEGRFADKAEMNELASIPGQKELYGMFVNVINSPIQGLVIALDAIAQNKEA